MAVALPTTEIVSNPQAQGYGARIDNLLLRLALVDGQPLRIQTAETQPDRIQTEQNPEDIVETYGRVFSRSDFSGGEGLAFMHRLGGDKDLDARRYWDSKNIDVTRPRSGEVASIRLLSSTSQVYTGSGTTPYAAKLPSGNLLYAEGSTVWNVTDPLGAESRVSEDPHTGTANLTGLVTLGDEAYASSADGIGKRSSGGTWSNLASAPADVLGLWAVKSRIIADVAGQLEEINLTTGATTNLGTALPTGETWNEVIDAGPVLLAAASDGRIVAFHEDTGTLTQVSETRLSNVDVPVSLAYSSGVVLVGTASATVAGGVIGRLWRAAVSDARSDFVLTDIQLLRTWDADDTNDYTPGKMASTRESIYTSVQMGTTVELWRYQLVSAGLNRSFEIASANPTRTIVAYGDRLAITVDNDGLWQQDTTFATSGYIVLPFADFFTAQTKRWIGMRAFFGNVTGSQGIGVEYATDPDALLNPAGPLWYPLTEFWSPDNSGVEVEIPDTSSRWLGFKVTFTSTGTGSPELQSLAGRGYPTTDDVVVEVPVSVSDRVERPNRRPLRVPGWGERMYSELLSRQGETVQLETYNPALTIDGVIERVQVPVVGILERGSPTLVSVVSIRGKLLTVIQGGGAVVSGPGVMGIGMMGVPTMGGID